MNILSALLLSATSVAALSDLRTRKIPNWLCYPLAAVAIGVQAHDGVTHALLSALCMIGVLAASLPVFSFGWLRGGDVKMIVACCGLVSYPYCIEFLIFTMLCGGFVAIAVALRHGTLRRSFRAVGTLAHPLLYGVVPTTLPFTTNKVPYGVAIFAGAVLTALSMTALPALRFF